jgi:hypothetical protein
MIRELFKNIPIDSIIISIIILVFSFIIIDGIASKPETFFGNVIDKQYNAGYNITGTGYDMSTTGKVGVIVTHEYKREGFLLMIKTEKGMILTVECDPELYYEKKIGQKIYYNDYKGFFTGLSWSIYCFR